MKLSTKTRYGVRAVFDLAYHSGQASGQVKEIAERQTISPRYLEQIFHRLKKAGIVRSQRGPKGGYLLARTADKITVGDIYRATEGKFSLVTACMRGSKRCEKAKDCVTMPVWEKMSAEIEKLFDSFTIESLCQAAESMKIPREIEKKYMYFI